MRITAYTYEADAHCAACTLRRIRLPRPTLTVQYVGNCPDENGVPLSVTDCEGNPVHPVFSTDEHDFTHCGTCREPL